MANAKKPKRKAMMLGLGLDSDGHKRITKGDNFTLVGGTKDTHEQMTEKAMKINGEAQGARQTSGAGQPRGEFSDIAHEVGLKPVTPKPDAN